MKWLILGLLVAAMLWIGARIMAPRASSVATGPVDRDGERRLGDCGGKPNCNGSEASDPGRRTDRWSLSVKPAAALDAIEAWVATEKGATVARRDGDYLHVTATSRLMHFVDDVEFLASEDASSLQVRSNSRLGGSDLGANEKRLARWHEALGNRI